MKIKKTMIDLLVARTIAYKSDEQESAENIAEILDGLHEMFPEEFNAAKLEYEMGKSSVKNKRDLTNDEYAIAFRDIDRPTKTNNFYIKYFANGKVLSVEDADELLK